MNNEVSKTKLIVTISHFDTLYLCILQTLFSQNEFYFTSFYKFYKIYTRFDPGRVKRL
jgi:hypothetical protein